MANIDPVATKLGPAGCYQHLWEAVTTANNTGNPIEAPGAADKTVQAAGTWGGATMLIEGSNDGTTYATLTDAAGNAISLTADGMKLIAENPRYIRPRLSVTGAGADIDVYLVARSG